MNRIRTILLITFASCSLSGVYAQKPYTLHDCMAYAVEHSTRAVVQATENSDARLARRDAILRTFVPQVTAGTYAYSNFGRTVDPETNTYISTTSFNNSYSVSASLTLFDGLSSINKIRISNTAVRMGISREQQVRDELCLAVMESYFNVLFQAKMIEVLEAQLASVRTNHTLVSRQYEMGQKSYPDVAQIEADLADREYQLLQYRNQRDDALFSLKSLMLWPVSDELLLDDSLLSSVAPASDAQLFPSGDAALQLVDQARQTLPAAKIAQEQLNRARYDLQTAKLQFLPSLSLNGGWSTSFYTYPGMESHYTVPFGKQWRNNSGEYVQISMTIPLFTHLSRFSHLSRMKNGYKRAQAQYRQTMHDVEAEVHRALHDCRGAWMARMQASKRALAQRESFRLNERKFEQGILSPLDYRTVSDTYLRAQAEEFNAILQYHLKNSVVNFYQGISYLEQ